MTSKIFAVYDTISLNVFQIGICSTAGAFVRSIAPMLAKMNPNFESEMLLYEVGELDEATRETKTNGSWNLLSWDVYKRPEAPATKMDNPDLSGFHPVNTKEVK